MQLLRENKMLAIILALLLVIKFVGLPLIEWQNELVWDIQQLNKRLVKINAVMDSSDESAAYLTLIKQREKSLLDLLYPKESEQQFKLTKQQWLETLLKHNNLNLNNIGWGYASNIIDAPVKKYQVTLGVEGNAYNLVEFFAALDLNPEWVEVSSFSVSFKGQSKETLGKVNGTIDLSLYQLSNSESDSSSSIAQQGQRNEN